MRKIKFLLAVMLLSSCGTLVKSESELLKNGGVSPKYCTESSPAELKQLIEEYHDRCLISKQDVYLNGTLISGTWKIKKSEIAEGTRYTMITGQYYVLSALVYKNSTEQCKSEMVVTVNRRNASADFNGFEPYKKISEGLKPSCW